jgi:hypothetical protein
MADKKKVLGGARVGERASRQARALVFGEFADLIYNFASFPRRGARGGRVHKGRVETGLERES